MTASACLFCYGKSATEAVFVSNDFDYGGVPPQVTPSIEKMVALGFQCCDQCAAMVRADDRNSLKRMPLLHKVLHGDSIEIATAKVAVMIRGLLNQMVFWLGKGTDSAKVIRIYDHVDRSVRLLYDLLSESDATSEYPHFSNGVELWCYPDLFTSELILVDLRSSERGRGHASRVMRFLAAGADVHEVVLRGTVELRPDYSKPSYLTLEQLYAWYERLGFRRDSVSNTHIARKPKVQKSREDRFRRFLAARASLRAGS